MDTYIFITTDNNSGSTVLTNLLSLCRDVITFPKHELENGYIITEGHFLCKKLMPNFELQKTGRVWTEHIGELTNDNNYDWESIKRDWGEEWRKHPNFHNKRRIFVEKTPHNVGRVPLLSAAFDDSWFLTQVRNPYVVAEGVRRRMGSVCDIRRAGTHAIKSLELSRKNLETCNQVLAWRYEDVPFKGHIIANLINDSIGLDFSFDREIPSKHVDNNDNTTEKVRDLNERQLQNLSDKDIKILNSVFDNYKSVMTFFNYERL